jgi:hypothetical protein
LTVAPLLLLLAARPAPVNPGSTVMRAESVFELMDRVARLDRLALWPGFEPAGVPVAVFDGKNTYAFGFPSLPKGFKPVKGRPGAGVFRGAHPKVRANRRIDLEGIQAASCIALPEAYFAGNPRDPAAIIMHEKFHVFQALCHPDWMPNDAFLFGYPEDTAETVLARRLEVEAFRRAVAARDDGEARGWAACALGHRASRILALPPQLAGYEDESQRLEGLAEYIEWRVLGVDPLAHLYDLDFAPAAVRNWGYVSGRWIGTLLDRLNPGWKDDLESGRLQYPHQCLAKAVGGGAGRREFSPAEVEVMARRAEADFRAKSEEREKLRRRFDRRLGWRVELSAEKNPLLLRFFLADQSEAFSPREMLHRRWLTLENDSCYVEVTGQDCLTVSRGPACVQRVAVSGLRFKPRVVRMNGRRVVSAAGMLIRFERAAVSQRMNTLFIRLGTQGPG